MGEMIERAKNILDHYAQKIAERKNYDDDGVPRVKY